MPTPDQIPKATQTRARTALRKSGQDYSEEDVERKAKELHQKYLANKEKAEKRAEKREEKQLAKDHMITIAVLPEGSPEVDLPRYYAVEKTKNVKYKKKNGETVNKVEKKYKLVNPLTKQRNIAQRQGSKPIDLKRKDIDRVAVEHTTVRTIPLDKFVPADQKKAFTYNRKRIKYDERGVAPKDRPDKSAFEVKERGRPEILPKNVYHHQNKGSSKLMEKLGKLRNPRQPEETKEETHQEEEKDGYEPPPRGTPAPPAPPAPKRGRPKKYQTAEEAKKAKTAMTVASNKRRRGEVRETEAMGQEDRPAPARPARATPEGAELVDYYSKILALKRLNQSKPHQTNDFDRSLDSLNDIIVYALLRRGYEPDDRYFSKLKNPPQPAEVTDDFKKEMNISFTAKTEQIKVKKGTVQQWFDEQKEKLRKMGVTAFDIKADYDSRTLTGSGIKSLHSIMPKYAKGSQEARDHMARIRAMRGKKGEGIIMDTLNSGYNYVVNKGKQAVGAVVDTGKQIGNTFSQVITGSTDYSPSVRKILEAEGNNLVSKIVVGRTPVQQAITMALNAVSQGQFQSNQDRLNYDKLFHLFSEITLENGKQIRVEKNEVITMTMGFKQDADTERQDVDVTKAVSFRDLLENARRKMKQKFFAYDSANNNCQDFIMALLQGSGLGSQENFDFIKQNTKQLFEKIPRTRALAKQITNLGQRINIAMAGGKISTNTIMPKFAKGSQEARDHMARIRGMRKMRGGATGNQVGANFGDNAMKLFDAGTNKLVKLIGTGGRKKMRGGATGNQVGANAGDNAMKLFDAGTNKLLRLIGTGLDSDDEEDHIVGGATANQVGANFGDNSMKLFDAGTNKLVRLIGTGHHIHHHHYHPRSYAEGGNVSYGGNVTYGNSGLVGRGAEYGLHHTVAEPDRMGLRGNGFIEDMTAKINKLKIPTSPKEAMEQLQILQSLTPQGIAMGEARKMIGSGPKGLKKFSKWTRAINDYLGPVANPIIEAGRDKLVEAIKNYAVG